MSWAPRQIARLLFGLVCAVLALHQPGHARSPSEPQGARAPAAAQESARVIEAHLTFLADDALEGREAGSRGERLAALYIAAEFRRLGLDPKGADGSYFQPVPLRSARLDLASAAFSITYGSQTQSFDNGRDVFVSPSRSHAVIDATAGLVFAGHGVVAPELDIDDYEGLDVAGKVVVTLGGAPASLPSAEAAHFASGAVKNAAAAERGAAGLIQVWMPANEAIIPFDRLRPFLMVPAMTWVGPGGEVQDSAADLTVRASVRGAAAQALFQGAPVSLDEVMDAGVQRPVAGFDLPARVSLALETAFDDSLVSQNVAGFLEGSDPALRDEVVVVTAHYDHVGLCGAIDAEDRICNGALDNALGVGAMLDVARRLALDGPAPRRSVLFLAVGAEEKGLLGAEYFVRYPTLGRAQIVANVNMDGGLPFYRFADVIAFGADQSTLGETLAEAVAPMGLSLSPDPFPEQSIFTRSDQYAFVKQGVPSLFLYHGFTDRNGDNVGRAYWDEFMARHYHQPSDDTRQPIDYAVAADYADVFHRLVSAAADAGPRPRWYADSVFGLRYAPDAEKAPRPSGP